MSEARALLVIDLVDSTAIAARLGDARMSALWAEHDGRARELLAHGQGREIDRSDGFFLLFDDVAPALAFARRYHAMLAALGGDAGVSLKARAGVHHGTLLLRANPPQDVARGAKPLEADGIAKAVAARVMSLARGGQTLLSAAACAAFRAAPDGAGVVLHSHGHWRLKGVDEPMELFEAGDEHTLFEPPADADKVHRVVLRDGLWLPAREVAHSLVAEPDAFIGRVEALRALSATIEAGARLVTVHGMGGSGKTRLALHHGWRWLGRFATGVWFCDLARARDLEDLVRAVAEGLQLPLGRGDAVQQIGLALAGRGDCLVIMDNFEQVVTHAEATLGAWMRRAPRVCFLVTSREQLRLPGERLLGLEPLSRDEGVALFRARAASVRSAPSPATGEDASATAALVDLLDGLPLAIELAAARTVVLSPRELQQRMDARFKLLSGGRVYSLHKCIRFRPLDWSWELLDEPEREALAQMSVFEGGATMHELQAALQLPASAPPVLDVIQSLVQKSLLRSTAQHRLVMLQTVHDYAAECLATPGRYARGGPRARADAEARHWRAYADLGPERAVRDGCAELDNLVLATRRAAGAGEPHAAVRALEGAWAALRLRGPFALGVELCELVAQSAPASAGDRARLDRVAGWALRACGDIARARERLASAVHQAAIAGDELTEGFARAHLADLHVNEGHMDDGRELLLRALELAERTRSTSLSCHVHFSLGNLEEYLGRLDAAAQRYTQALELARAMRDRRWEGGVLGNLGLVRHQQGQSQTARALLDGALAIAREMGDRQWEGNNLCNLGLALQQEGDLIGARAALEAALVIARELGYRRLACVTSTNLGLVDTALGADAPAQVMFEDALTIAIDLGDRRTQGQVRGHLGALLARRGRIADARLHLDQGAQLLAEVSDRLSQALLQCDRAECECVAGNVATARQLLEQARAVAAAVDAGPTSELGLRLGAVEAMLDRVPGDAALSPPR